ncbi:uncharacterized protein LOC119177753 isoform X2 [Rhipicephalus microplus]|uniref:uncharacterized protein LOC119177753 isoform X2 n=1 Tax=Rhipicephalus microplus TaxID=6941 RepID=UPI003F6B4C83
MEQNRGYLPNLTPGLNSFFVDLYIKLSASTLHEKSVEDQWLSIIESSGVTDQPQAVRRAHDVVVWLGLTVPTRKWSVSRGMMYLMVRNRVLRPPIKQRKLWWKSTGPRFAARDITRAKEKWYPPAITDAYPS